MKKFSLFLFLAFLLINIHCFADDSMYLIAVPVATQSQDDWQKGVTDAFSKLIVKISGRDTILDSAKIKTALPDVSSYVQSFTYLNPDSTNPQLQLQIQFYPQAINKIIHQAGGTNNLSGQENAQTNSEPQQLIIHITQIDGLNDYADVMKYIKSLSPISNINSSNIESSDIVLSVTAEGGAQALIAAINAGTQMQSITPPDQTNSALYFKWINANNNNNISASDDDAGTPDVGP